MSTLAIILIVVVAVVAALLLAGAFAIKRRESGHEDEYRQHLAAADHALEGARASDRGWDRAVMEDVARAALNERRPEWDFGTLDLVLVDDRPGVSDDRAHFEASDGDERLRVVLARGESGWTAERVG
ncbi:MAG: hypothetical protein WD993_02430 [Thermoleophilaceae bacterium]